MQTLCKHTTTIGIREQQLRRHVLNRRTETLDTPWGPVGCKISSGYGVTRRKYEYEDLTRIARQEEISLAAAAARLDPQA